MKVSIITVCFNSVETIENTIKNLLKQDYDNIEYIVVDGGSTDGTVEVINNYRRHISKVISETDNGIYDAMNKGLRLTTGEIIGFLNSDDLYADKSVIRRIVNAVKTNKADCCYGNLEYVTKGNPEKIVRKWISTPYRDDLFSKGWHPPHPTFFARKHLFDRYGCFDLSYKIAADYELMLRFLKKYKVKSCYIPHVIVKMRIGGKSNKNLKQIIKANFECYRAWKKNNLSISPLIMLRKPTSKLRQYL